MRSVATSPDCTGVNCLLLRFSHCD